MRCDAGNGLKRDATQFSVMRSAKGSPVGLGDDVLLAQDAEVAQELLGRRELAGRHLNNVL